MSELSEKVDKIYRSFNDANLTYLRTIIFFMEIESLSSRNSELNKSLKELESFTKKLGQTTETYLRCALFSLSISNIELYFQEILRAVLSVHPKKLASAEFSLQEILDASAPDILIMKAADGFLNKLMYKKPSEYLGELVKILAIDAEPIEAHWAVLVEAKARRDLGMHNGWKCNETYLKKASEASVKTSAKIRDILLPDDTEYLKPVIKSFDEIAKSISSQVSTKYK